jgi:hypothetical protein
MAKSNTQGAARKYPAKLAGKAIEMKLLATDAETFLVFRYPLLGKKHSYHVFVEIEAKDAADRLGAKKGTTHERWDKLWGQAAE